MKRLTAFTLIELLVVISIVAMLASVAYSAFAMTRKGYVTVTQFGERHSGKLIEETPTSVTIKTSGGRTITVTHPYTLHKQ